MLASEARAIAETASSPAYAEELETIHKEIKEYAGQGGFEFFWLWRCLPPWVSYEHIAEDLRADGYDVQVLDQKLKISWK